MTSLLMYAIVTVRVRADPLNAFSALAGFSGKALTVTLPLIEQSLIGKTADN
jgi:hypothetical protein